MRGKWVMAKDRGMVDLELIGDRELIQLLKTLDKKLSDKLMFDTLKKGSEPLLKAARANLATQASQNNYTGLIKYQKAIKFQRTKRYRPEIIGYVGPDRGRGSKPFDFWFAHMIEYGTSGIKEKKSKRNDIYRRGISSDYAGYVASKKFGEKYREPTPAMPFMRPAIQSHGKQSEKEIMTALRKVVLRTWKRGAKKAGWMIKVPR